MSEPATTFKYTPVETFPLKVEVECPVGKGYFIFDCKVKTKEEAKELRNKGLTDEEYFRELVTDVRGVPGGLTGEAAMTWILTEKVSMWALSAFIDAYFEQFGEARRKNGQKLHAR